MTPKEKANDLFEIYLFEIGNDTFAKNCALVAVNEIIKSEFYGTEYEPYYVDKEKSKLITFKEYWQEIKQELEKL